MQKIMALFGALILSIALAQQKSEVLLVQGDLWLKSSSGGQLSRLTNYGHNYTPMTSPDGKWVAFLSVPEFALKYAQNDEFTNVWLMNLKTKKATRIGGDAIKNFARRGALVWSGDNKAVAWVKLAKDNQSVVVYNLAQTKIYEKSFEIASGSVRLEFSSDGSRDSLYNMNLEWHQNRFCAYQSTNETQLNFGAGSSLIAILSSGKMMQTGCGGGG
jgi:WD40-like Beta Propeller Repeat